MRPVAGPRRGGMQRECEPGSPPCAMSILAIPERLMSERTIPDRSRGELQEERVDRQAIDHIFGPVLLRNEGALLSDDPSFQGAISTEPLTQLEIVALARE